MSFEYFIQNVFELHFCTQRYKHALKRSRINRKVYPDCTSYTQYRRTEFYTVNIRGNFCLKKQYVYLKICRENAAVIMFKTTF